jgi:poly-gamma-glutamate synthesis protein (capsule biosynthesis protein)
LFRVETVERLGWRIGFVALTTRRNAPQFADALLLPFSDLNAIPGAVVPLLETARKDHDLLIVVIHWGNEYEESPDVYHRKVAHALIDGGADLVIAHHPHVLQAIENYKGKVIAYSLGNFLFENTTAIPRLTGVLRVRFEGKDSCLKQAIFHPAVIIRTPSKHPAPATGGLAKTVRARVIAQAKELGTEWTQASESEDLVMSGLGACAGTQ